MKFGLFIEEIWAKIAVGTLIYHWKSILAVGSKSGSNLAVGLPYYHWSRRINTDVIWAVRSRCMKEGKYHKKIMLHRYFVTRGDFFKISPIYLPEPIYRRYLRKYLPIYRRYFGDIYGNISPPIFLHEILCRPLPIHDISPIYPDIFLLCHD